MLRNIEAVNETFVEEIRKKKQIPFPGSPIREKPCNKALKLTGLSNSGG